MNIENIGESRVVFSNFLKPLKKYDIHTSAVSCHGFFISNGKVYSFGRNDFGQCSKGDKLKNLTPSLIKLPGKVSKIACGMYHTLFLVNGKVYGVGYSQNGELSVQQRCVLQPQLLVSNALNGVEIVDIKGGKYHSVMLGSNGCVYVCGYNKLGQLGLGHTTNQYTVVKLNLNEKVIQIGCGISYTMLLTEKRELYYFGGEFGGLQSTAPKKIEAKEKIMYFIAGWTHCVAVGMSEKVYGIGDGRFGALSSSVGLQNCTKLVEITCLKGKGKLKDIRCGVNSTYFLMRNGNLYSCGYNCFGDTRGNGTITANSPYSSDLFLMNKNVFAIEVVTYGCFILLKDGWHVCGSGSHGIFGLGDENSRASLTLNNNFKNVRILVPFIDLKGILTNETSLKSEKANSFTFEVGENKTISVGVDDLLRFPFFKRKVIDEKVDVIKLKSGFEVAVKWVLEYVSGKSPVLGTNVNDLINVFGLSVDWKLPNLTHFVLEYVEKKMTVKQIVDLLFELHKNNKYKSSALAMKCFIVLQKKGADSYVSMVMEKMNTNKPLAESLFKLSAKKLNKVDVHNDLKGWKKGYNNADEYKKHMKELYKIDNDSKKDLLIKTSDGKYIKVHSPVIKKNNYLKNLLQKMTKERVVEIEFPSSSLVPIIMFIYDPKLFSVYGCDYFTIMEVYVHSGIMGITKLSEICLEYSKTFGKDEDFRTLLIGKIQLQVSHDREVIKRKEMERRMFLLEERLIKVEINADD